MTREPRKDTSQRGILCKRPRPSMAVTISVGRVAAVEMEEPILPMAVLIIPAQMLKIAVISSMQLPTATFAIIKRIKWRRANSGRWKSRKLAAL